MAWVIAAIALGVLAYGAWAGTGKFTAMPDRVTDTPKLDLPEGPVDELFVAELQLPVALNGYNKEQVRAHLNILMEESPSQDEEPVLFDVVFRGYDMASVDALLEHLRVRESSAQTASVGNEE